MCEACGRYGSSCLYALGLIMKKSRDFGMGGGGIAREIDNTPLIERFRIDTSHDQSHINYEVGLNTLGRSIPLLTKHKKINL